jgi:hypothetical protein
MAWVTKNDLLVGIDVADDGLPADARMCPLFHVTTVEPLSTDARAGERPGIHSGKPPNEIG